MAKGKSFSGKPHSDDSPQTGASSTQASLPLTASEASPPTDSTVAESTVTSTTQTYFSRSALAEKLKLSLKELTQLMIDAGWIRQEGKEWILTSKGEFEGGIYRQSKKYGQYIAWPERIQQHSVIVGIDNQLLSASAIAKQYALSGRLFNRLLAEMGWLQAFAKGWQVSEQGRQMGGQQHQDNDSGIPYVMWPRQITEQPVFANTLAQYLAVPEQLITTTIEQCTHYRTLDGHYVLSVAELTIANWLYVVGIHYAYRRTLCVATDESVIANFYLPAHHVYLDYWAEHLNPTQLTQQLQRRDIYQQYQLQSIEIPADKLTDLDHYLSKALLGFGITVY